MLTFDNVSVVTGGRNVLSNWTQPGVFDADEYVRAAGVGGVDFSEISTPSASGILRRTWRLRRISSRLSRKVSGREADTTGLRWPQNSSQASLSRTFECL